jgi:hypothetical protein
MAYTTAALVKTYLGITGATDDVLIGTLIDQACTAIDSHCSRTFSASADSTRYYTVGVDTFNDVLYLDEDLCAITSVSSDADGTTPMVLVEGTDYVGLPRNTTPYHALKLLGSSSYYWTYTYNAEMGIEVVGKFAYSTTAPNDIIHAAERLVGYYYRQKDSQVFDVTAIPDAGIISIPQGIPADVKLLLKPYVRLVY